MYSTILAKFQFYCFYCNQKVITGNKIIMQKNSEELISHFIKHTDNFWNDSKLNLLDRKHDKIVGEFEKKYSGSIEQFAKNIRNWSCQSDMGAPRQISLHYLKRNGTVKTLRQIVAYVLDNILPSRKYSFSFFFDDLAIIKMMGAEDILLNNPVHETPDSQYLYFFNGTSANVRWLRYIYFAARIREFNMLDKNAVWLDIGPYYGGLQGIIKKLYPDTTCFLVDFNHQLCRSYVYLHKQYPEAKHILPDELDDKLEIEQGSFVYVPTTHYKKIKSVQPNLFTNFFSFGEMKKEVFLEYLESAPSKNSINIYIANRFVSSPFFETTYDTDTTIFDYQFSSHSLKYFDILPIHHYQIPRRNLFGRMAPRPTSSPYFEMHLIPNQ